MVLRCPGRQPRGVVGFTVKNAGNRDRDLLTIASKREPVPHPELVVLGELAVNDRLPSVGLPSAGLPSASLRTTVRATIRTYVLPFDEPVQLALECRVERGIAAAGYTDIACELRVQLNSAGPQNRLRTFGPG